MRRARCVVLVASLFAAAGGCAARSNEAAGVPCTVVRQHAATWKSAAEAVWSKRSPGGVVAVEFPGSNCRWVHTFGVAKDGAETPYTADLQQPIGSVTKTLTATVALQLVAEGRIALDDTIDRWFPEVEKADAITIAMLLNMSSGIEDYVKHHVDDLVAGLVADPTTRRPRADLIALGTRLPRVFDPPGSAYAYSNTNTLMVAAIVEAVTGNPFERELQRRVIDAAGLDRTTLLVGAGMEPPFAHGSTTRVPGGADTSGWTLSYADGAGGAVSDIDDLLRWGRTLGEGSLLTAALRDERLRRRSFMAAANQDFPMDVAYGLGAIFATDPGSERLRIVMHSGQVIGYEATVAQFPVTGGVIAALANSDGGGVPDAMKNALLASTPEVFLGE